MALAQSTFEEWNTRLAMHFFNPGNANKRVYLHTTTELLDQLGGFPGAAPQFVAAVKQGPGGVSSGDLCTMAIRTCRGWRTKPIQYPPYIAYLCLLALAATREGHWAAYAYHPRLRDLLGEPGSRPLNHFYDMSKLLWRDLEQWTHNDTKGTLGLFTWQYSGPWIPVGLPVAQTLLTDAERKSLPELFRDADLEPGAQVPEGELAAALAGVSHGRLCHRTCVLLNTPGESDHKAALLDTLQSELLDWDGTVNVQNQPETDERRGGLRIWLKRIDAAGFVDSRLVAYLPDSTAPEDLLLETAALNNQRFTCDAQAGRITTALQGPDGRELPADRFDWAARMQFKCLHTGTRLVLPAARVRMFTSADSFGFGGFIETRKLPPHGAFFLAAAPSAAPQVAAWGQRCCPPGSWQQVPSTAGLPQGWTLFRGADLKDDGSLSAEFPALSLPRAPRLSFEGGIKLGSVGAYFPFALPTLCVEWHDKPTAIDCNKVPLQSADGFTYPLDPTHIQPVNSIEALFGDGNVVQLTLFVQSDGWSWSKGSDCPAVDRFGKTETGAPGLIRGAIVDAHGVPDYAPDPDTVVDDFQHAVLLGRKPGQIANIRRGDPVPEWAPVWAVSVRRRDIVFAFCGSSLDDSQPEAPIKGCDSRKWADLLWVHRKRVKASPNKRVRQLLKKYQEAAHAL